MFDNEYKFAVAGYSRRIAKRITPKEINALIYTFCKSLFKWTGHSELNATIKPYQENQDKVFIKHTTWKEDFSIIGFTKYAISSKIFDKFEWEIEINDNEHIGEELDEIEDSISDIGDSICFKICFVDGNKCDKDIICDYFLPNADAARDSNNKFITYSVYVWTDNYQFKLYGVRNGTEVGPSNVVFASGDTIKLSMDFIRKECALYYNGEFIDVIYKNIPDIIIPGFVSYSLHSTITCTKFTGVAKHSV